MAEGIAVLVFFIFLQIADGLFTYHGVNAVGINNYEANPLISSSMHRFGVTESIFVAKALASLLIYFLYRWKAFHLIWLSIGFYLYNFLLQIEVFFRYYG